MQTIIIRPSADDPDASSSLDAWQAQQEGGFRKRMQDHLVALGAMDVLLELIDDYTSPARNDASDVNTIASSRSIFLLSLNVMMLLCERHRGVQAMTRHHITYLVISEHFWDQAHRDLGRRGAAAGGSAPDPPRPSSPNPHSSR